MSFTGTSLSDTLLLAEAVFLEGVADGVSDEGLLGVAGVGEGSRTFLGLGWGGAAVGWGTFGIFGILGRDLAFWAGFGVWTTLGFLGPAFLGFFVAGGRGGSCLEKEEVPGLEWTGLVVDGAGGDR